jgi:small-conductance mechanosensitive channel
VTALIRRAGKKSVHPSLGLALSRIISAALTILGAFVAAAIIFPAFSPGDLVAGLGITSLAVGLAFKDILENFFAGLLILWREPFVVGDEIRSGEFSGTVQEITTRSTRLRTASGESVILPNGDVYGRAIIVQNASGNRRLQLGVTLPWHEQIDQARDVVRRVVGSTDGVLNDPKPLTHVSELNERAARITIYCWVNAKQNSPLDVTDRLLISIKRELSNAGIELGASPTMILKEEPAMARA